MDRISILPYDVIALIFDHLEFRDRVRCSGVCKTWRMYMLDLYECVVVETPKLDKKDAYSESLLLWLSRIKGDTAHHLKISFEAPQFSAAIMDLIATNNWTRLESILLCKPFCLGSKAACQAVNASPWMTMIRNCSSHLRELNLHYPSIYIKSRDMMTILTTCNRLTRFYYRETKDQFDDDTGSKDEPLIHTHSSNAMLPYSNLTHLTWWADYDLPFETVLPLCPKLVSLTVRDDEYTTSGQLKTLIELLLQKRNPRLRFFSIGGNNNESNHVVSSLEEDAIGLRYLNITPWKEEEQHHGWLLRLAADLFAANYTTLLSLSLAIDQHDALPFWTWICQPTRGISSLTSLTYCFPWDQANGAELESLFYKFLMQCPHLAHLSLENVPWNMYQLLRVLSASFALTSVVLNNTSANTCAQREHYQHDSEGPVILPSLRLLDLALPLNDTFLQGLGPLENLTHFVLGHGPVFSSSELERFLATKAPQLKRIEMHGFNCKDAKTSHEVKHAMARLSSKPEVFVN
ncbi:hypothetical protein BCR43DRAFT_493202 [Syncephalastrum racemosum]|uniref:F-box domain-containing protein n=1 Tax=Syncephalastrum racemosum TaxID=13706 RepID=A0A1X2HBJ7_SYNRA|nr:hypothetical protein BCR43DRAFT_493202 [Syncephalastrum racemosum]